MANVFKITLVNRKQNPNLALYPNNGTREKAQKEAGTKVLVSQLSLDYRARRSG